MSMHTYVIGFKPPDEHFVKMKAVWDSCVEAGIEPPEDVNRFFDWTPPEEEGVEIRLEGHDAMSKWDDGDMREGFQVDIAKLDPDIKIIRFVNSY